MFMHKHNQDHSTTRFCEGRLWEWFIRDAKAEILKSGLEKTFTAAELAATTAARKIGEAIIKDVDNYVTSFIKDEEDEDA